MVTVLFADVAHYTAMSEKLDPEEVRQIVDGCFASRRMKSINGKERLPNSLAMD